MTNTIVGNLKNGINITSDGKEEKLPSIFYVGGIGVWANILSILILIISIGMTSWIIAEIIQYEPGIEIDPFTDRGFVPVLFTPSVFFALGFLVHQLPSRLILIKILTKRSLKYSFFDAATVSFYPNVIIVCGLSLLVDLLRMLQIVDLGGFVAFSNQVLGLGRLDPNSIHHAQIVCAALLLSPIKMVFEALIYHKRWKEITCSLIRQKPICIFAVVVLGNWMLISVVGYFLLR